MGRRSISLPLTIIFIILFNNLSTPYFEKFMFDTAFIRSTQPYPKTLDDYTTLEHAEIDGTTIIRNLKINQNLENLEEFKQSQKQNLIENGYCDWFNNVYASGFVVEDNFIYAIKGHEFKITFNEGSCKNQ